MKLSFSNRLSMVGTTEANLTEHAALVSTSPMLVIAKAELSALLVEIRNTCSIQAVGSEGATNDKQDIRTQLARRIHKLSAAASSIPALEISSDLRVHSRYAFTDLETKIAGQRLYAIAEGLRKMAVENAARLAAKGYTAADLAEYSASVALWSSSIVKPRTAITRRAAATRNLQLLLRTATDLLTGRIDKLMLDFKDSHPDFWHSYKSARVIVDLRGPGKKESDQPLSESNDIPAEHSNTKTTAELTVEKETIQTSLTTKLNDVKTPEE